MPGLPVTPVNTGVSLLLEIPGQARNDNRLCHSCNCRSLVFRNRDPCIRRERFRDKPGMTTVFVTLQLQESCIQELRSLHSQGGVPAYNKKGNDYEPR